MKCPKCNYKHGWDGETNKEIVGSAGKFFVLPIKMEKENVRYENDRSTLYACPKCGVAFIEL